MCIESPGVARACVTENMVSHSRRARLLCPLVINRVGWNKGDEYSDLGESSP
jgi:hypothetical protein